MTEFKITYKNGDTQTVHAETYKPRGGFFVFLDGTAEPVHTVPSDSVESISRGDVSERVKRGPMVA